MKERQSPQNPKCPKCDSEKVAEILWGMPAESPELHEALKKGELVLGGCCVTDNDPNWHCNECGHEWGRN